MSFQWAKTNTFVEYVSDGTWLDDDQVDQGGAVVLGELWQSRLVVEGRPEELLAFADRIRAAVIAAAADPLLSDPAYRAQVEDAARRYAAESKGVVEEIDQLGEWFQVQTWNGSWVDLPAGRYDDVTAAILHAASWARAHPDARVVDSTGTSRARWLFGDRTIP